MSAAVLAPFLILQRLPPSVVVSLTFANDPLSTTFIVMACVCGCLFAIV